MSQIKKTIDIVVAQIKTNTQENRRLQGEVTEVKNRMQSLDDKVGDLSQN